MEGMANGKVCEVEITAPGTPVVNYGFDITPARLVTGIITERGISNANKKSIFTLFPEKNLNPSYVMKIAIIGGTGLALPDYLKNVKEIQVNTPFGKPDPVIYSGQYDGLEVFHLGP